MKKLSLISIIAMAAAFTACSDDESSGGDACLFKYEDGSQMCIDGDASTVDLLCGGSSTGVKTESVSSCPSGATATCPDDGMGITNYYYEEGATCSLF
ncbi:MAG: hypothetical protein K6E57_06810 [Fibrobacter sp.]|jgi:hypothetical protein|nr:hypothetical protein [Fibrobacter sp.]MCR5378646.1 hypothetical protein [Fibrobacter sp.]